MEIALCYIDIIVPVPYRYSTGSRGSVPVSAVRSSNPSSTCSTRPSTGTVRTGRNPGDDCFGVVGLQTDDTLTLGNLPFADKEEKELQKAKFLAKPREQLTHTHTLLSSMEE